MRYKEFEVPTDIGILCVTVVSGNQISLSMNCTIRKINYRASLHARKINDEWTVRRDHDSVYIRKSDVKYRDNTPSDIAKDCIIRTAENTVRGWVTGNLVVLLQVERQYQLEKIEATKAKVLELQEQLTKEKELLNQQVEELQLFQKTTNYGTSWHDS